jgi:hypothetical protein
MTIQNNHFNTRLPAASRPAAAERPAAPTAAATSSASGQTPETAAQAPASPVGLVGNHVNTTA